MKKKKYIKPVVSVMELETTAILASSVIKKAEEEDYSDDNVKNFWDKVLQFYTCDINAQELCAKMEMSSAMFNRRFKRAFGMPCGEWLNSKRQVQVLMDLKTTDLSVKEIAEKYNLTPNYLTDFCKKFLGDVPGNLR